MRDLSRLEIDDAKYFVPWLFHTSGLIVMGGMGAVVVTSLRAGDLGGFTSHVF